jgi:phosphate-selective porin OprO/OprP
MKKLLALCTTFILLQTNAYAEEMNESYMKSSVNVPVNDPALGFRKTRYKRDQSPAVDYPTIKPGFQVIADGTLFKFSDKDFYDQEIRRARVFLKGYFTEDLSYEIEYSLTGGGKWKDLYIEDTHIPNVSLVLGHIKEPIGLEALTSSKYNTFMERATPDTFISERKLGLLASWRNHNKNDYTFRTSLGAFGPSINDIKGKDGSYSIVGRTTYAYFFDKSSFFHLGAAASYTEIDNHKKKLYTRAGSHLRNKLIKTKVFNATSSVLGGIEAAYQYDAISFQSEVLLNTIKTKLKKDYSFMGWYAQVSYFITDDKRRYKAKDGVYGRVKPSHSLSKGGYGAWETALRISNLDMVDKEINGGELQTITAGINWYATSHIRTMLNYITTDFTGSRKVNAPEIFQLRLQYDY